MANKIRGRNEGSIWRQGNRWRAAVSFNGKRLSKSFRTKADCKSWIREMQNKIDRGLNSRFVRVTLEQYLAEWLCIHKTRLKPKTTTRYAQISRDYIFPYLGNHKLVDLRVEHIEGLYQTLLHNGQSNRNVRYVHSILHRSLSDAVNRGIVIMNAAHGARKPKLQQKEMMILDEYQVMQFFITIRDHRHEALLHLAIKTGMRQGELLALRWSDLDWTRSYLRIQRQVQREPKVGLVFSPPKTKAGRRTIPLGGQTLQLLRKHRSHQNEIKAFAGDRWKENDLIFPSRVGTPQSSSNLLKEFKQLLVSAGLPEIRFHDMRHTAASLMLNKNVPGFVVSKILGHSQPSTTMNIYGHLIPIMHENVGNLMDELLTPIPVVMGEKWDNANILESQKP